MLSLPFNICLHREGTCNIQTGNGKLRFLLLLSARRENEISHGHPLIGYLGLNILQVAFNSITAGDN